jgi:tetratricopeptide (TPR) repeat protein
VDPRERWQALQARLAAARRFVDAGDRAHAIDEIDAALAIDPEFLAAQSLRERILSPDPLPPVPPVEPPAPRASANLNAALPRRPVVSVEGYARFEERAKRRRVDRRLDAARAAIDSRRLRDAAAALDEVIELDPNQPELPALAVAYDALRRSTTSRHRGPWIAAAAAFGLVVLGASWIDDQSGLLSHPVTSLSALVSTPAPQPLTIESPAPEPVATQPAPVPDEPVGAPGRDTRTATVFEPPSAVHAAVLPQPLPPAPVTSGTNQPAKATTVSAPPMATAPPLTASLTPEPPVVPAVVSSPPAASSAPSPAAETDTSTIAAKPRIDDEVLVKQALQRYRVAYDGLDARSAQAVWPAVNQAALARAFDGLESQNLTFDRCDVQLQSETAAATCHGTARYVPKIGSREPRIEPRIWIFSLRRAGTDWKISSARVDR